MNLASYIDHTVLKPDSTRDHVTTACNEALEHQFASVCILPWHVQYASDLLAGSMVAVCTVAGFPLGASTTSTKVAETITALANGAREIDMVASLTAFKSGKLADVLIDIVSVVDICHDHKAIVKVIIETCLLTNDEKLTMCEIVTEAGADFIKTSTGFSVAGATVEDVQLLRSSVGPLVHVKASGGIRDIVTAEAMIKAGASRLGTSSGVLIVK